LTANNNSNNEATNVEAISVVKTFDNPSNIKPRGKPIQSKYEYQETKPKVRNQDKQENQPATKSRQLKDVSQLEIPANPQVTIVIPLNNSDEFLEEALQSVKRQTYQDWLGIIGVSGQTGEDTFAKATDIVNNLGLNNRFKVINLPDVKGAANTINHMVGQATTPLIAHLDADDLWLSKKLEFQMAVLDQDHSIGIVGTMCRYFGDSNDFKILPPGLLNVDDFKKNNPLIQSSILIKREYAIFTNEFTMYDYECWFRNVKNGVKAFNVNNILVLHRIHSKSFFNTSGQQDSDAIKQKYSL
jgi:teichuronic acid biosynthesis glycosyltransferase TuaG